MGSPALGPNAAGDGDDLTDPTRQVIACLSAVSTAIGVVTGRGKDAWSCTSAQGKRTAAAPVRFDSTPLRWQGMPQSSTYALYLRAQIVAKWVGRDEESYRNQDVVARWDHPHWARTLLAMAMT
nr:hypothetical protein CFP56_16528 [Quercus suber]